MDDCELPPRKRGSVKEAITSLEQQIYGGNFQGKKSITNYIKANTAQWSPENREYVKVMRELESLKVGVARVQQDFVTILEQKRRAEEDEMCSSMLVESLTREIEEINEEHLLVVVARVEALKECRELEAQRRASVEKYMAMIEESQKKTKNIMHEIDAATTIEDKSVSSSLLETITTELKVTKRELTAVKEDYFECMTLMDILGNELHRINEAAASLEKKEEKTKRIIQSLNSKLLKAKSKMEAISAEADRAKPLVSNLLLTLKDLKSEGESGKKELNMIVKQTCLAREEARSTENEMGFMEERLLNSLKDLIAVTSSESKAIEKLKAVTQTAVRSRASASQKIKISKFEHDYLMGNAARAREIADMKVAAAEAWIEAIKASEKQIVLETDLVRKETGKLNVEKNARSKGSVYAKKTDDENDFEQWRLKMEPANSQLHNPNNGVCMTTSKGWRNSLPVVALKHKDLADPTQWARGRCGFIPPQQSASERFNSPSFSTPCKKLTKGWRKSHPVAQYNT